MKKRFTLLSLLGLLFSFYGNAQQDTVVRLSGVTVVQTRIKDLGSGIVFKGIDSAQKFIYQQKDLSSVLTEQSLVFVRSQGPGNLATTSIRGAGSQHTAVLWNGLNLNNSMNGLVDLSLIPNGLFDGIAVQYGSSTALWGSGALGGAIHIENYRNFKSPLTIGYGIESTSFDDILGFNGVNQNFSIGKGTSKSSWSVKVNHNYNDNKFLYSETNQNLSQRNENILGSFSSLGVASDFYWQLRPRHQLQFHYWIQNVERNVSPSLFEVNSNSRLEDLSHRLALNYWANYDFGFFGFRSGLFLKDLLFTSDNLDDAPSKSQTYINELYYILDIDSKHLINIGVNNNFNVGRHKNYADIVIDSSEVLSKRSQNLAAFFASYKYTPIKSRISFSLNLRQEWRDSQILPFTFDFGSEYRLNKAWLLAARISKMYRVPNLNDLFWNPGGNPNLQAESGYASELSTQIEIVKNKSINLNVDYAGFYRRINNWIQWTPGLVWSPENLLEVESFGNEWEMNFNYKIKDWSFGLKTSYSYVISQNIKASSNNSESLGRQLIYTPINQVFGNAIVKYKNWYFNFNQQYVGYVYTASDHSQFIEPYNPANVRIQYNKAFGRYNMAFWLGINNIFNEDFQVVRSRPMPLRSFTIGFKTQFKKIKTKNEK